VKKFVHNVMYLGLSKIVLYLIHMRGRVEVFTSAVYVMENNLFWSNNCNTSVTYSFSKPRKQLV
jgi:hypothetical protein